MFIPLEKLKKQRNKMKKKREKKYAVPNAGTGLESLA